MSTHFKPTFYSNEGKEKQLLNSLVGNHDLVCGCDHPTKHIASIIFKYSQPTEFDKQDTDNIKKCLGSTPAGDGDAVDGLLEGDLEKLFEEDLEEEG